MQKNEIVYIVREDILVPQVQGFNSFVYNNAIEGLQKVKSNPLIVVIDLGLTRVTGIDCLKMIRSNPFNYHIKTIVCMKKYNYNLIKKSFNYGADFYMKIPFDVSELESIIVDISKYRNIFMIDNNENIALQNHKFKV